MVIKWLCGLEIRKSKFEEFKEKFDEEISKKDKEELIPLIKIDSEVKMKGISKEMIREFDKLEPFGEKNNAPVFSYRNLKIVSVRALTEGRHLKLVLKDENDEISAIRI